MIFLLLHKCNSIKDIFASKILMSIGCCLMATTSYSQQNRPNIIVILVDDLGYGDIGAYNDEIDFTPHIDQLAKEGMLLTDFHSNGPMCSPTRAAFITGKYQYRFGKRFESALSSKKKEKGMPLTVTTIPKFLKKYGYSTGIFGKWHLGFEEPYVPNNFGFDEFKGLLSGDGDHHTHINRWGLEDWWQNGYLNMENGYSTKLITDHSIDFIEQNKDNPFFLNVSQLAIHFPWQGPQDPPHRKKGGNYGQDKWGIMENEENVRPHIVEMIKAVDESVYRIIGKLMELNIDKNTIVIFTSDNGGYTHYYQGPHKFENISINDPLRGQKTSVYEGGHRVPFIIKWPGKIKRGVTSNSTAMTMDLFPTFASAIGEAIPDSCITDGVNLLPVFLKDRKIKKRYLYWKIGKNIAVRYGPEKMVRRGNTTELYNLKKDIGERNNLSERKAGRIKKLATMYEKWISQVESEKDG